MLLGGQQARTGVQADVQRLVEEVPAVEVEQVDRNGLSSTPSSEASLPKRLMVSWNARGRPSPAAVGGRGPPSVCQLTELIRN